MNPVLIGGAIVAALALLKKKQDSTKTGGGTPPSKPPPVSSSTEPKSDLEYFGRDAAAVAAGALGALGTIGGGLAIGGGSVGGVLSTVGGVAAGVVGTLGLACIPLAVIALLIAAGVMGARTAEAKSMARAWINYLPSARIMVAYETARIESFCVKNTIVVQRQRTVLDPRLEATFTADGQKYTYIGERDEWRKTDSAPNAVPYIDVLKAIRAAALVYAMECGRHANALLRNWGPKIGNGGHSQLEAPDYWLNHLYDALPGYEGERLGGLNQVPLPSGETESARVSASMEHPPAAQLRGVNSLPAAKDVIAALVPEAKFCAFKNVLQTIHMDTAIYLPFDPKRYAMDVYNRMELDPQWFVLQGSVIVLPFGAWQFRNESGQPVHLNIDVQDIKDKGPMANWYQTAA